MAFIIVVATTHVITMDEESKELRREMRLTSESVPIMHNMLSAAYGNLPLFYINPKYMFSTEDTVMYIYEGKGTESDELRLVSSSGLKQGGVQS
eukprot:6367379-Ditylum_brightwellii.AAC.1